MGGSESLVTNQVDAHAAFTRLTQRRVVEFVDEWRRLGCPFCLLKPEFIKLLHNIGCSENDGREIFEFWALGEKVDMLEILLTAIIGAPMELSLRINMIYNVLDFEERKLLSAVEVAILVSKIMHGLHKACDTHRPTANELDDIVFAMSQGFSDKNAEEIEAGFISLLRELGTAITMRSRLLRTLAKKITPIAEASFLRDTLEVGAFFMSRYRIVNINFPPDSTHMIELSVFDEIPPKVPLLIRLLLVLNYDLISWSRNFMREASLLTKIDHAFSPHILTFGETDEYLFQICEAERRQSLSTYLDIDMSIYGVAETSVIQMLLALLGGLDSLQEYDVVHTNIQPGNIRVNTDDFSDVKLVSWELASWDSKVLYGHSVPMLEAFPCGSKIGRNPLYAAPEQLHDGFSKPNPQWDLYALGIVAFECVSGNPPFRKASEKRRIIRRNTVKDPRDSPEVSDEDEPTTNLRLPDIRNDVLTSDDFIDIIERMLDKDPGSRISSSDLQCELTTLLDHMHGLPVSVQKCLPHLAPADSSGFDTDEECSESVLDLRAEARSDFTCRYLAKFANELTVPLLRITGGDIPLNIIRNPFTTVLELRNLSLASHDIMVVAQTLGGNRALTSLDLHNNVIAYSSEDCALAEPTKFELAGLRKLASNIADMPLQMLDLSNNCLGLEGGVCIGRTVKALASLVTLKLAFCKIMAEGGLAIASALPVLTELTTLDLSYCLIGNPGAIALAQALDRCAANDGSRLDTLALFSNKIDNEGGTALMATLESNFTLLSLSLGDNAIPEVHHRVIQRAIGFNNQYRSLKLRNDKFEGFGHNLMAESLKTWGRGNMFIVQRLLYRLQRPRDALEESVAAILLSEDGQSIKLDIGT